jgi:lysozyme family protein
LALAFGLCIFSEKIADAKTEELRIINMDNYKACFEKTMEIEGGFVDDPDDAGGTTKFGVSLRFLKKLIETDQNGYAYGDIDHDGDIDDKDIEALTIEDVERIMRQYFWNLLPMDQFETQPRVQWKLFDLAIHASPYESKRVFQRAVKVYPDGIIGEKTLAAAKAITEDSLLRAFSYHQLRYYNKSVIRRPLNLKYLSNWMWRADQQL